VVLRVKKFLVFLTLLWMTDAALAVTSDLYTQASSGISKPQQHQDGQILTNFKASRAIKAAMGRKISNRWRADLSIDNVNNPMKIYSNFADNAEDFEFSARGKLTSLLANAYYDFHFSHHWFAFVGTGIGPARLKIYSNVVYNNTAQVDAFSSAVIAYHNSMGLGFKITKHFWLTSTYRHLASTPLKSQLLLENGDKLAHRPHHRSDAGYLEIMYFF
jgi:opacity protein-like surface antigen